VTLQVGDVWKSHRTMIADAGWGPAVARAAGRGTPGEDCPGAMLVEELPGEAARPMVVRCDSCEHAEGVMRREPDDDGEAPAASEPDDSDDPYEGWGV
jgi:hypothetical protein